MATSPGVAQYHLEKSQAVWTLQQMLGSQTTQTEAEISAVCVYWRGNFAADMSAVKSNNNEDYMHVNTWYFG